MESFSSYQGAQVKEQDFQKLAQTIGSNIQKISRNVTSLNRMVNQIGTHQDSRESRKELHSIQSYTQQLVKDTNGYIKHMDVLPPALSQLEQKQWKMQRERLHDEFTSVLNEFQISQRNAASKEKEQIDKAKFQAYGYPFTGPIKKDYQLIELQDNASSNQQQQIQEETDLRTLREQELAVRQLESDIKDVNDIFKELGSLVHKQGELVDSIEANVERTENYVSEGAQQLREASTYKNKIRKKKLILAAILTIVSTVIILILYWQFKD